MSNELPLLLRRLSVGSQSNIFNEVNNELRVTAVAGNEIIERINELTELRSIIDLTLQSYYEDAAERLASGHEVTGMKVRAGTKRRKITNELIARSMLNEYGLPNEALYEQKMIGIPAIEKLLKAEGLANKEVKDVLDNFVSVTASADTAVIA